MDLSHKVGLITMLDSRPEFLENYRADFGQDAPDPSQIYDNFRMMVRDAISGDGADVVEGGAVDSHLDTVNAVKDILLQDVHALVIHIPGWTHPSFAAVAARMAHARSVPVMVWASFALSGPTASKGAIDELGIPVRILYGAPTDERVVRRARKFLRAAGTFKSLEGSRFGMIGGRSMGVNTGVVDASEWLRLFGIDADHTDQLEIVRRAGNVDADLVGTYVRWLHDSFGRIVHDERRVTDETIERAVRSYLATKQIVEEKGYDFIALKCQPELSDAFVNQCLSHALLNDPYDAEGSKEPICCSCEADGNGALTMHLLKYLSGGKPVLFADVITFDDERNALICQNCGGAATWFADANAEADAKLKSVDIVPNVQGQAGGPALNYYGAPVGTITWARLARRAGSYCMHIVKGELVEVSDMYRHFLMKWPTVAVKMNANVRTFMERYPSQHVELVAADVADELVEFCRIAGIPFDMTD